MHFSFVKFENIKLTFMVNLTMNVFLKGGQSVSFILLLLIIVAIFITLLFVDDLKVKLLFNTDKSDMNVTLFWLYPLIKVFVTIEDTGPALTFYLFNKHIFKKFIKEGKDKASSMDLIKIANPKEIRINANYGFSNPFTTGITCGVMEIASQFINIESIKHNPDFMTISDYIYLDATANVNLGTTFINLLRQTINRRKLLWIRPQT